MMIIRDVVRSATSASTSENELRDFEERTRLVEALLGDARAGQAPLGLCTAMQSSAMVEIAADFGVRWVLIDREHTAMGRERMVELIRATELAKMVAVVKLNAWERHDARDALDCGAEALMIPHVDSAEELRDMLSDLRFPPDGPRGYCSLARVTRYSTGTFSGRLDVNREYVEFAGKVPILPSIESLEAVNDLDALLTVPGIAGWHLGLEDLSMDLGDGSGPDWDKAAKAAHKITKRIVANEQLVSMAIYPTHDRKFLDAMNNGLPWLPDSYAFGYGLTQVTKNLTGIDRIPPHLRASGAQQD
jgi:4-hydroxy-2-oxoheptanedioate aldolase